MDLAARQEEIIMREKFSGSMIKVAIAAAAASTINQYISKRTFLDMATRI